MIDIERGEGENAEGKRLSRMKCMIKVTDDSSPAKIFQCSIS